MSDMRSDWKHFTDKVKEKWHQLTDEDIAAIDGDKSRLQSKLEALGHAKGEADKMIKDWEESSGYKW